MIPELLNGTSHRFPKCVNIFCAVAQLFGDSVSKGIYAVYAHNYSILWPIRIFFQKYLMH